MNAIQEIQNVRSKVILEVDAAFAELIHKLEESSNIAEMHRSEAFEVIYPISVNPSVFKGKKPTAIIFGNERVTVKTWKMVLEEILHRCNADQEKHKALMCLRDKISGRERTILSAKKADMRSPMKIGTRLYIETHYDTETMLRILLTRILREVGYDYSNISVAIRNAA